MPTFHDPVRDAEEAAEALRGLAHATRAFDDLGDTYWVQGNVLASVRRLSQVLQQLAEAHRRHQDLARTDAGSAAEGMGHAQVAHAHLREAVVRLDAVHTSLDLAMNRSGQIAWSPPEQPSAPAAPTRLVSGHSVTTANERSLDQPRPASSQPTSPDRGATANGPLL
jgi:hypothetical protein